MSELKRTRPESKMATACVVVFDCLALVFGFLAPIWLTMNGDYAIFRAQILELPSNDPGEQEFARLGAIFLASTAVSATIASVIVGLFTRRTTLLLLPIFALILGLVLGVALVNTNECQVYYAVAECS